MNNSKNVEYLRVQPQFINKKGLKGKIDKPTIKYSED